MRRLLLAAAGLALLVPAGLSQTVWAQTAPSPGGPRGPGMMPPPPSRAAHFHLQRGDALVDVKCADTVNAMLDKLAALPAPARN